MTHAIAHLFRSANAQLLYRQGLIERLLKGPYFLSVLLFKRWTKKKQRPASLTIISNYDRNIKIEVDISKTMGASMFWTGFHELNEMRFLNQFLKQDMVFVDVGANQGEFSLFAAKRLTAGLVLAFEPMSLFFERLQSNVALNSFGNIKCFKLGLSDLTVEAPIYYNRSNPANHEGLASLYPVDSGEGEKEIISLTTLDSLVGQLGVQRIDFIKIDVEGAEWAALRGAEQVLRNFRPALMVELNQETSAKAGYEVSEMISWLRALGFTPYELDKGRLVPLTMRTFCNAVFIPANQRT